MRKSIELLKVNHTKNISDPRNNLHFPVLNDNPLENYTLVQGRKIIEINDDLDDIFIQIIKLLYFNKLEPNYDIYAQPMCYRYDFVNVQIADDKFKLNDFSDINICYFKLISIYTEITQTIDNAKATVNIDDVLIVVHNNKIKIQVYYKMHFHYDIEKCIFTDCFFEVEIYRSYHQLLIDYKKDKKGFIDTLYVVNTASLSTESFQCAFESHISEVILKAKARTEERIEKYVADTYSKLQTQLIKDKFKDYINKK